MYKSKYPSETFTKGKDYGNTAKTVFKDEYCFEEVENTYLLLSNSQDVMKQSMENCKNIFRRFSVQNDGNLPLLIFEFFNREKCFFVDWKTRWNSLLAMLERFYELRKEFLLLHRLSYLL